MTTAAICSLIPKVCISKFCMRPITIKIKIGEKSSPPIGGITLLMGPMTGSVICQIRCKIGCGFMFPENIMTNDMMIDPMIA